MSRSSRSRRTLVLVTAAAALCAGSALAAASGASADAPLVITREAPFLVADASGPVVIADDDFTFDCQHHEIRGNGEPIGLDLTGRRGVTVVNCSWITGFQTGISLVDAAGNTLNGETMGVIAMRSLDNALVGIDMTRATGNTIDHVSADSNGEDGIRLSSATGNRFVSVLASDNADGFDLEDADNNRFERVDGSWNRDSGMDLDDADGNVVTASTFYANEMDGIDGDRSTGNRIEDNDIRENRRFGIHLVNRSVHNVVRGNTVTDNGAGIVVRGDNVVEDNITS